MRSVLRSARGITILETVVTVGIASAVATAALPNLAAALSGPRLQAATRESAQHVRLARAAAVAQNTASRVVVSEDGSTLTTEVEQAGSWVQSGTPLVLGGGVQVVSVAPSASALRFDSQGMTSGAVTITFRTTNGEQRSIAVSLLGSVDAS
jgi:Tfp pilus assembly protein FimT